MTQLLPSTLPIPLSDSVSMSFQLIPAGEFLMGSPTTETDRFNDESPQHLVKISQPFYMSVHGNCLADRGRSLADPIVLTSLGKWGRASVGD